MSLDSVINKMVDKYVITTAQMDAGVNKNFLKGIETYCKYNDAELIILPVAGKSVTEEKMCSDLNVHNILDGEYVINNSIKISNYKIKPQQINPLTGIKRFAQGDKSFVFASTKQVLEYVANSYNSIPKAIMTTGAVTKPNYRLNNRIGRIAKKDHEYGFIVVEKQNSIKYHFRHVKALNNGKFVDLGKLYNGKAKPKVAKVQAMVLGDIHPYDTDPNHVKMSLEQIKVMKPEQLFLHDTFNGRSISHHYKGHNIRKYEVFQEQGLSLEKELKKTLEAIKVYADVMNHKPVYIVASNHDEHLKRYLDEGRFIGDKGNDFIASQLYTAALTGHNVLEYGLRYIGEVPSNVVFLERDEDLKINGVQLANHGDLGANGGRGSLKSIEEANGKSITGHSHSAAKKRNTYKVGTSTYLRLDYNRGYSSWTQTNALLYGIGTVQLINTIGKKWKL